MGMPSTVAGDKIYEGTNSMMFLTIPNNIIRFFPHLKGQSHSVFSVIFNNVWLKPWLSAIAHARQEKHLEQQDKDLK